MPEAAVFRRTVVLAGLASAVGAAVARDTPMAEATNLRIAAAISDRPLVLLVSLKGCPFCEFVRRSYLLPLMREGLISALQLSIDRAEPIVDFAGKSLRVRDFVAAALAAMKQPSTVQTPTVLFFNSAGEQTAEPLVGVVSSEFYGAMLNSRLKI